MNVIDSDNLERDAGEKPVPTFSHPALVLVVAGGTGGHLFPAEALSVVLAARGFAVELATDERAQQYGGSFPARAVHRIPAAAPTGGSIAARMLAIVELARGTLVSRKLIAGLKPLCVVGFGGYPTVPPLFAASLLRVPTLLHEQNAVLGRANRFLARRVTAIATGFPSPKGDDPALSPKTILTGNPVRPAVIEAARSAFPDFDGRLNVLVTGGSQGARVFADVVPAALEILTPAQRAVVRLVQQARGEDEARVRDAYARLSVAAEVAPFFTDLPARMAASHLVIARSGASTVSELAVIGRPSILVPFPFALDQDQAANAAQLSAAGAAEVVRQTDFSPQWLAARLAELIADPTRLADRAMAARATAVPDAAERLADLLMQTIERAGHRPSSLSSSERAA
jgi:UDP-N-acetylglucosamine--N-acetylmuramyl-(pentapeptide) pyrophosphoryl-undecaprenol N-acetylglucosamine transferase